MLKTALSQYGITEIPGRLSNPEVEKYFKSLNLNYSDDTAWCSAFLNWVALQSNNEASMFLTARSWLQVGIEVDEPEAGNVVILWRESPESWKGHVGIYINETEDEINVLGGNQNNMVCIKPYPKDRLLGYRKLRHTEG